MPKVMIELDLENPIQRRMYDQWHLLMTSTVPHALIDHLKTTETYRKFLRPLADKIEPNEGYTAKELGELIQPPLTPRGVASAIAKIGKPEKTFRQRVIQRESSATRGNIYIITEAVRDELVRAASSN